MCPSLESLSAQETNSACIPSLSGDIGCFQREGNMTLPLLEGHLLVLGGPVECGRLENELSCHCAVSMLIQKFDLNGFECRIAHNGAKWRIEVGFESVGWFCSVQKWWITLSIIVGLGCNFDTIWGPIRVTSDVSVNCLPILLLELLWFECVFNTLSDLLTWVHNRHDRHNGIWKLKFGVFGLVLAWVHRNGTKNAGNIHQKYAKCNGLERNQMVLKEPYTSLTLTVLLVYLIKHRGNGLEQSPRSPPFTMCQPYWA